MRMASTDKAKRTCSSNNEEIHDAAIDWAVRRDAGLTPSESLELERWLKANPDRADAFEEAQRVLGQLCQPRQEGQSEVVVQKLKSRRRRRLGRTIAASVVAIALAALSWDAMLKRHDDRPLPTAPASIAACPDRQILPDGSMIQLNAEAEIQVEYGDAWRRVRLLHGEIFCSVAKDPRRPFVVYTPEVEVKAVGTEFSVRRDPATVDVLVTEGRVAVARLPLTATQNGAERTSATQEETVAVDAGTQARVATRGVPEKSIAVRPVSAGDVEQALAWCRKRVEFSATPLNEAVDLFNRQNKLQLTFASPGLGELRVSGIFWADNPESFARLLEISFPLRAERVGKDTIVMRKITSEETGRGTPR